MEKGWKLIKKYGKKIKILEGHDTTVKYYVVNDVFGLGRIEPFLHDNNISSIVCDGYGKNIEIEINGKKLETNVKFYNADELVNFISGVATKIGKKISRKYTKAEGQIRNFMFYLDVSEIPKFMAKRI